MDTRNTTILLIEDDPVTAEAESGILRNEGYQVVLALTGENALRIIQTLYERIDLILVDINLGNGIDGIEVAETILKDHDIPVIFLSSMIEKEIVEKTEKISSYGFVVKSSTDFVLFASIKMALRLHQSQRELKMHLSQLKATTSS